MVPRPGRRAGWFRPACVPAPLSLSLRRLRAPHHPILTTPLPKQLPTCSRPPVVATCRTTAAHRRPLTGGAASARTERTRARELADAAGGGVRQPAGGAGRRWAREGGEHDLHLPAALWRFWWLGGHLSEGRGWLWAALARQCTTGGAPPAGTGQRAQRGGHSGVCARGLPASSGPARGGPRRVRTLDDKVTATRTRWPKLAQIISSLVRYAEPPLSVSRLDWSGCQRDTDLRAVSVPDQGDGEHSGTGQQAPSPERAQGA